MPIPGEVIDPRYHVNFAWHSRDPDLAFQESLIAPHTRSHGWDLTAGLASKLAVPTSIPEWKGKAALREVGLLDAVEAAALAIGGRVQDAWAGASEWDSSSRFLLSLAGEIGLGQAEVDHMFREAAKIQS